MKQISFKDMTISADIWKGTFDVECRGFRRYGLRAEDLAELVYPAVDARAGDGEAPASATPESAKDNRRRVAVDAIVARVGKETFGDRAAFDFIIREAQKHD